MAAATPSGIAVASSRRFLACWARKTSPDTLGSGGCLPLHLRLSRDARHSPLLLAAAVPDGGVDGRRVYCTNGHRRPFHLRLLREARPLQLPHAADGVNGGCRTYFTNGDRMKESDPYAQLGLTWGATTTEIKEAYRSLARKLHPDVTNDPPDVAMKKFQSVRAAYDKLMDVKGAPHRDDLAEEWSFAVWRNGDVIAQERTDVAGVAVKRPVRPAAAQRNRQWGVATLGHPAGGGIARRRRAEYIGDGGPRSSTVGTGRSKWVKPKAFKPWNPSNVKVKGAGK